MAEITLSTLFLFFLSIPGYIARTFYHTDKFTRAILPQSHTEDLVAALLYSFPLHYVAVMISELIHHSSGLVPDIDFVKVIRFLSANFEKEGAYSLNAIVQHTYNNWPFVTAYIVLVLGVAGTAGTLLRHNVWRYRWDLKYPALFKFRNYWLYRLTGRGITHDQEPTFTVVDALVPLEKGIYIYGGVLASFIVDERGELLDLLLIKARRAEIPEDAGTAEEYVWVDIPGSLFVVRYDRTINLNLSYYALHPDGRYELLQTRQF